jgi:hypothetical protein
MTQEQFIYWLRGFITNKEHIGTEDTDVLREELGKISAITHSPFSPFSPYNPLNPPIINPPHEPYIKGPSDERDSSKMPMFT